MGSRIETRLLGELVSDARSISYGIVQPGPDTVDGVPIVRVCDINGDSVNTANLKRVSSDIAAKYSRTCVRGGELLVSVVGTPGLCVIASQELKGSNLARAIAMVPIKDDLLTRWCRYQILSSTGQQYIEQCLNTTVQKTLNLKELAAMPILIPSREVMAKSIQLLDSIERLACSNKKTNDYLSDMLDALFDEVVTGESFDWESASLLDIANYKNGLAMQRFRPVGDDRGLPVLKIRELGQGYCGADAERCRSDIDEAVAIHDGDLVFSWSGTLLLDFWAGGDAGLNQHLFKVTSDSYPSWFYYMWTKQHMRRFITLAKDRATTMGHIKRSALQESEVFIPPSDRMEELTAQMQPIVDEMIGLKVQSRKLGELRDALLPKLMAGEIDTAKIELDDAGTPR